MTQPSSQDGRFTISLITDVLTVLTQHGYRAPEDEHTRHIATGRAVEELLKVVHAYEGTRS